MPKYIDADALKERVHDVVYSYKPPRIPKGEVEHIVKMFLIDEAPSADVAEVRRGEWIDSEDYKGLRVCSACHDCYVDAEWINEKKWVYCPSCGADMRGKEKENG